jgi:3-oxoadipate enol-lactonase
MTEMVAVNGFKIATKVSGKPGAPWITLSNSLGTTHRMWAPQMSLLEDNFRVLCYDTRGHGQSDVPPAPYSFNDLISDVIALLDHFSIQRTDFMGLSIGGMTALGLALSHPERLNRIICADARAVATEPFRQIWKDRAKMMDEGGVEAVWPSTRERWFIATNDDDVEQFRNEFILMPVEGLKGCGAALQGLDYLKNLSKITTPTFYIGGESDSGAPSNTMQEMANATPGSHYHAVPGAAHIANFDNPGEYNKAIANYLGIS